MFLSKITLTWSALTVDKLLVSPKVITCSAGRWLNTTDSMNTDQSEGTKMKRWRNGKVTHSANRPLESVATKIGQMLCTSNINPRQMSGVWHKAGVVNQSPSLITATPVRTGQLMNCTLTSGSDKRFFLRRCPNSPTCQTTYSMGTRRSFLEVKAVGASIWPVAPI